MIHIGEIWIVGPSEYDFTRPARCHADEGSIFLRERGKGFIPRRNNTHSRRSLPQLKKNCNNPYDVGESILFHGLVNEPLISFVIISRRTAGFNIKTTVYGKCKTKKDCQRDTADIK